MGYSISIKNYKLIILKKLKGIIADFEMDNPCTKMDQKV